MNVNLGTAAQRMIEERFGTGRYASPEKVLMAGLAALQREEANRNPTVTDIEKLLDEGERSGEPLDGEEVLAELRALRAREPLPVRPDLSQPLL